MHRTLPTIAVPPSNRSAAGSRVRLLVVAAAVGAAMIAIRVFASSIDPVDFLVYRYGAALAAHGGDIYAADITGDGLPGLPFTYPPFAAVALLPTTLGTWRLASVLWSAATLAVLAWVVHRALPARWRKPAPYAAALLAAGSTTVIGQHLDFGQINVLLMGLVLADLYRRDDSWLGRALPRGVLVGVAAAIKLTPALFIVFFLVTRQWRPAGFAALGFAAATAIGAIAYPAMSMDFWTQVIFSLSDRVDLGGLFTTSGNNSISGSLAAAGAPAALTAAAVLIAAVASLWAARHAFRAGRTVDSWLIVGLGATLVSPVSWIHHWVYLVPAAVVLIVRHRHRRGLRPLVALVLLSLAVGPTGGDLLLATGQPLLVLPGLIQRECLALAAAAAIVLLARGVDNDVRRWRGVDDAAGRRGPRELQPVLRPE